MKRYWKTEGERLDYDFDFTAWLAKRNDSIVTFFVGKDDGIEISRAEVIGGIVRVYITGGTNGKLYKVSADVVTDGGRKKHGVIQVAIRGVATDMVLDAGAPGNPDGSDTILDGGLG